MYCKHCGYKLEQGENFCVKCGTPVGNYNNPVPMMPPQPMPPMMPPQPMYNPQPFVFEPPRPTCGSAVASMIFGITSIFLFGPLASIPAIVLGAISMKRIDRENLEGRGYAITGLVSGIIVTIFWAFIIMLIFLIALAEA